MMKVERIEAGLTGVIFSLFVGLLLATPSMGYAGWMPVSCEQRSEEVKELRQRDPRGLQGEERRFRGRVLKAKPGDGLYVPTPYPRNEDQILANFEDAYFGHLHDSVEDVPAAERPVYDKIRNGEYRLEIIDVENWDPGRCFGRRPAPRYRLLRFYDLETGAALLQASQHESGHLAAVSGPRPGPFPMPALEELPDVIERMGVEIEPIQQAQYVRAAGFPWRCTPEVPCVGFRSGSGIYVLSRGGRNGAFSLYEIRPDSRRESVMNRLDRLRAEGLTRLGGRDPRAPVVSLGFEWAEAALVASTQGSAKQ